MLFLYLDSEQKDLTADQPKQYSRSSNEAERL
jgi:hypothetical protein